MGNIPKRIKTAKPSSEFEKTMEQEMLHYTLKLDEVVNGGLKFSDNINCEVKTVADTGAANTEFTVAHTLKVVPSGFLLVNSDKAAKVYASGTSWTTTNVYLKADAANCEIKVILLAG